ncbi:MAG: FHA domain-containing protein, partial [Deltaproteobacteria bacterium]|nr:FHA domain-containing protein [Deltaproteobacteria bacterium]
MRRSPSTARLIELSGPRPGRVHYLGREATVGRDESSSVAIDSSDVSRQHARLRREKAGWLIEDLESRNGTLVNGVPIRQSDLRTGDEIQVGSQVLFV